MYEVVGVKTNENGETLNLTLTNPLSPPSVTGPPFQNLSVELYEMSNNILRVRIIPVNDSGEVMDRYQVPGVAVLPIPEEAPPNPQYYYSFSASPFSLNFSQSGQDIWCGSSEIQYEDQYLEYSFSLSSPVLLYGIGERVGDYFLHKNQKYTMWNQDQGGAIPDSNLYGTHPVIFQLGSSGTLASGIFFLNSNAMEVDVSDEKITWISIGGVMDFYYIVAETPDSVVQAYLSVIGAPHLPAYWSLGFHQSRYGYSSIQELNEVSQQYELHNIPLDTLWSDIDYMDNYLDFTFSPDRYPLDQVCSLVDHLHKTFKHYVVIVDPGISNTQNGTYLPYDEGAALDIFLKEYDRRGPMIGDVWPGLTVFPDFPHEDTLVYWDMQISRFLEMVDIDGIWIDMNEISSRCPGGCPGHYPAIPNPDPYDVPPYNPLRTPLNLTTISISTSSKAGLWYDLHSLYGFSEQRMTHEVLQKIKSKRSFTLSRSTFAGSGRFGAHWLGDNFSTWSSLRDSIIGILSMQIFGISLVGADICGFNSETTEELCTRWQEVGALYPFSRNHNAIRMRSQEPYAFSRQHLQITKKYLAIRYSLLPYYYTLFFDMSRDGSCCVWRPLFFEHPEDPATYDIQYQFYIGDGLMAAPVLEEKQTKIDVYFPEGDFYDFYTGEKVANTSATMAVDAPIDALPLYLAGGTIVPTQIPSTTTYQTRLNDFILLVPFSLGKASGTLVLDDGESLDTIEQGNYDELLCSAYSSSTSGQLSCQSLHIGTTETYTFGGATFYGVNGTVSSVKLNEKEIAFSFEKDLGKLQVDGIRVDLFSTWTLVWA